MTRRPIVVLLAGLLLAGCGAFEPSRGECHGAIGEAAVEGPIDPEASSYYRYGAAFRVELSYAGALLETTGVVPDAEASYRLPRTEPAAYSWDVVAPSQTPALEVGLVRVTEAGDERMKGSFDLKHQDGSVLRCTFDLQRDRSREDDGHHSSDFDWDDWD